MLGLSDATPCQVKPGQHPPAHQGEIDRPAPRPPSTAIHCAPNSYGYTPRSEELRRGGAGRAASTVAAVC